MIRATSYLAKMPLNVLMTSAAIALGMLIAARTVHATPIGDPVVLGARVQTVQFYGGPYRPHRGRPYYGGGHYRGGYGRGGYGGGHGHGGYDHGGDARGGSGGHSEGGGHGGGGYR